MTVKQESDLSITCMITDRIGRHKVLLAINHNHYNFQKKSTSLGETSPVGTVSKAKIWKFPGFLFFRESGCCYSYCDQFCDWWI